MQKTGKGSAHILKLIAIITMLIDHMGVLIFPQITWLRLIGRISFPIFAYGIAEGFRYTSDRKKYGGLLLVFACISQIPYMYLSYGAEFHPYHLNVIFMLLYGYGLLFLVEKVEKKRQMALIPVILVLLLLPSFLENYLRIFRHIDFAFSYSTYGLVMIVLFYLFSSKPLYLGITYLVLSLINPMYNYWLAGALAPGITGMQYVQMLLENYGFERLVFSSQFYSIVTVPLIAGIRERDFKFSLPKLLSYFFYPVHISILLGIHFLWIR